MRVEFATPEDAREILYLQKQAYLSEALLYNDFSIQPIVQSIRSIEEEFRTSWVWKIQDGKEIVASVRAFADSDTCYIGKLIVKPSHQNRGLGKQLMQTVETTVGYVSRFELFTGHKSEKNIALYQKLGYHPFRERAITTHVTLIYMQKMASCVKDNL
jgi:ribosomal protein S18 acetylase RimI-like enzyme